MGYVIAVEGGSDDIDEINALIEAE